MWLMPYEISQKSTYEAPVSATGLVFYEVVKESVTPSFLIFIKIDSFHLCCRNNAHIKC